MISNSDQTILFVGEGSYRTLYSARGVALYVLGFACAFLTSAAGTVVAWFHGASGPGAIMFVLAVIMGAFLFGGFVLVYRWKTNRIDKLLITSDGISYGGESWSWDRIKRIQIQSNPSRNCCSFLIDDQRCTHPCIVDGAITRDHADALADAINLLFEKQGLKGRCWVKD